MKITLYSKPACVQCEQTKRSLAAAGLEFETIDLTQDAEAMAYVTQDLGFRQAPVVIAGDEKWAGFRPDLIGKLKA